MDSSTLLIQAASGLEKNMIGSKPGIFKDSTVAQISALIYYQSHVIAKLSKNKAFINKFHRTVFTQIDKEFGEYLDAKARSKPKSLHHVYEWKKVGDPSARLFKLKALSSDELSFKIETTFLPSRSFVESSGNRRHVFKQKAFIMEQGNPIKVSPRSAERLVFEFNGMTVFMPKGASVTVKRPGGPGVKNQFMLNHSLFFTGNLVSGAIKRSGFQKIFNDSIRKALRTPSNIKTVKYSFSPNSIRLQADTAIATSFGGVM